VPLEVEVVSAPWVGEIPTAVDELVAHTESLYELDRKVDNSGLR
jgi:hypothetical protein